jgi:hypothetical protein
MNPMLQAKITEVARLCDKHGVRRMELFGSGAGDVFDRLTSDLDFLVTFEDMDVNQYADAYFGLLEALEELFARPVDLVVASAVTNPYFLESIAPTRTLIYAH